MVDGQGRLTFFDREWVSDTDVPLPCIFLRALYACFLRFGPTAEPKETVCAAFWPLLEKLARLLELPLDGGSMQEYLAQALKLDIFLSGREFPVEDLNALRLSVMPRVAAIPAEELEWTKRALNEMMLCMQRLQGRRTSPDK